MLRTTGLKRSWKILSLVAVSIVVLGIVFFSGFVSDVGTAVLARLPSTGLGHGAGGDYYGPVSLEERIVLADVIARVKMRSVDQTVERRVDYDAYGTYEGDQYVVALEFTFDVLEYLKGSGGSQVVGIADDFEVRYRTKLGASLMGEDFLSGRDERWDDRQAIVFLRNTDELPSTGQADRYLLGTLRFEGEESYTIANRHYQAWLPSAAVLELESKSASVSGVSPTPSDSAQLFLLEEPLEEEDSIVELSNSCEPYCLLGPTVPQAKTGSGFAASVSRETAQPPTITLSGLKTRIAQLQEEVGAGDGSEDYRRCVFNKYELEREVRHTIKRDGKYHYSRNDIDLSSGAPAGSHVYSGAFAAEWLATHGDDPPDFYLKGEDWLGGKDAALFSAGYPVTVSTARPLPEGKYNFYYYSIPRAYAICDGMPQEEKERQEYFVNVTASVGMLHEAFFDPTDLGGGATGGGDEDEMLLPGSFADYSGRTVTIKRIAWDAGKVTLQVDPHSEFANHHLDFVALDGLLSLRLDFDDAVEGSDDQNPTLSWGVCSQPWSAGDKLMLRISESGPKLLGAINDSECLSSGQ